MSYPVNSKQIRKDIKAGYKRFLGHASGWQAHLKKGCTMTCWYCLQDRKKALNTLVEESQERGFYE